MNSGNDDKSSSTSVPSPRVGLFVTCLIDLYRPNVGFAAVKLLEDAGCTVEVPRAQTCCGQPAMNNGDYATARDIAKQVVVAFEGYDYVVGAVRLLYGHHQGSLPRSLQGGSGMAGANERTLGAQLRVAELSDRRYGGRGGCRPVTRALSLTTTPAPVCAS